MESVRERKQTLNLRATNLFGAKLADAAEVAKAYAELYAEAQAGQLVAGEAYDPDWVTKARGIQEYSKYLMSLYQRPATEAKPKRK